MKHISCLANISTQKFLPPSPHLVAKFVGIDYGFVHILFLRPNININNWHHPLYNKNKPLGSGPIDSQLQNSTKHSREKIKGWTGLAIVKKLQNLTICHIFIMIGNGFVPGYFPLLHLSCFFHLLSFVRNTFSNFFATCNNWCNCCQNAAFFMYFLAIYLCCLSIVFFVFVPNNLIVLSIN